MTDSSRRRRVVNQAIEEVERESGINLVSSYFYTNQIKWHSKLLLSIFQCVGRDISLVRDFCRDRYGLTNNRLALFGVSLGVLQAAYAFTANNWGERLLGTIGYANLQTFTRSWGGLFLPDLAVPSRFSQPLVLTLIKSRLKIIC